jgi:hypothetical protein
MAQSFLGAVTLFTKMVVTQGATNGDGKVPQVIHADAIGGATSDKLRCSLRLHGANQENAGYLPSPQAQRFEFVTSLPVRGGIFGQHYVVEFCLQARGKLLWR